MEQVLCPVDGQPCALDCPDRYHDTPGGGCFLTTAQELGAQIYYLGGDLVGMLFNPGREATHEPTDK